MRLIDADKIPYTDELFKEIGWYKRTYKNDIDKLPTVEAIPIDCLQKLVNEWENDGDDYVMNCAEQLYHLIEEWRRINGKQ